MLWLFLFALCTAGLEYIISRVLGFDRATGVFGSIILLLFGYSWGLRLDYGRGYLPVRSLVEVVGTSLGCWVEIWAANAALPWTSATADLAPLGVIVVPSGFIGLAFGAFDRWRFRPWVPIGLWAAVWGLCATAHSAWQLTALRLPATHFFVGVIPSYTSAEYLSAGWLPTSIVAFRGLAVTFSLCLWVETLDAVRSVELGVVNRKLRRWRGAMRGVFVVAASVALLFPDEIGLGRGLGRVRRELSAEERGITCTVRYPPNAHDLNQVLRAVDDCDWAWKSFEQLGPPFSPNAGKRLVLGLYRDRDQLRRLTGCSWAAFARSGEIHSTLGQQDEVRLLEHELAHLYTYADAGITGALGLNQAWREGLAESLEHGYHEGPATHGVAARLHREGCAREATELLRGQRAWPRRRLLPKDYVLMGSFCGFLLERYGWDRAREFARHGDTRVAYGRTLDELGDEWIQVLEGVAPASWNESFTIRCNLPSTETIRSDDRRSILEAESKGDWNGVVEAGAPVAERTGSAWAAHRVQAALIKLGELDRAQDWLEQVGEKHPESKDATEGLRLVLSLYQGQDDRARTILKWLAPRPTAWPSEITFYRSLIDSEARALAVEALVATSADEFLGAAREATAVDSALGFLYFRGLSRFEANLDPSEVDRVLEEIIATSGADCGVEQTWATLRLARHAERRGELQAATRYIEHASATFKATPIQHHLMEYELGRLRFRQQRQKERAMGTARHADSFTVGVH